MIQLITPIADNNKILGNTYSSDSRPISLGSKVINPKRNDYYISLGPSIQILIEDEKIFRSLRTALQHLHLYHFASGLETVPQQFINLIRSPLQFSEDDLNTYLPLIFYLTGILNVSLKALTTELTLISPINAIRKRIDELPLLGDKSCIRHKQNMLLRYNLLQISGSNLPLSLLYDLVNGKEDFFLLALIIITIDSMFPKQMNNPISLIDGNNELIRVDNALDIPKNLKTIEKLRDINLLFSKLDKLNLIDDCNVKCFSSICPGKDVQSQHTASTFDIIPHISSMHTSSDILKYTPYLQQGIQKSTDSIPMKKENGSLDDNAFCNPIQNIERTSSPMTNFRGEYSILTNPRHITGANQNSNGTKDSSLDSSEGNKAQSCSNGQNQNREASGRTNISSFNKNNSSRSNSLNKHSESNVSCGGDDNNNDDDKNNNFNRIKDNKGSTSTSDSDSDSDADSNCGPESESILESESNSVFSTVLNNSKDNKEENDIVEMLADLFPVYPKSELLARVQSMTDIEELIDTIFLEQEEQNENTLKATDAKTYSSHVYTLKEIFPGCEFEVLQKILNSNAGDIALASAEILQNSTDDGISSNEKKSNSPFKNKNNMAKSHSSWNAMQMEASRLEDILNVPSQQILSYLHKHEGKFHETLVAIINENSIRKLNLASGSSSSSRSSVSSLKRVPRGGRVQGLSSKTMIPVPSIRLGSAPPDDEYKYDENSLEAKEIRAIYVGNPEFKSINEQFFEKSLVFFRGDVAKVIEIVVLLVQEKAGHCTFKEKPSAKNSSGSSQIGASKKNVSRKKKVPDISLFETSYKNNNWPSPSASTDVSLSGSSGSSSTAAASSRSPTPTDEISRMEEKLKSSAITNSLDLHNLTVPTALKATGLALRDWWKDELDQRHVDGKLTRFGWKVQFVSPFNLITGRGIHSEGGKSKIRIAVKNYLTRNNYVFEEYSGRFEIEGKR